MNVKPRSEPYIMKVLGPDGIHFNEVEFIALPGGFVNLTPPVGPRAQQSNDRAYHRIISNL